MKVLRLLLLLYSLSISSCKINTDREKELSQREAAVEKKEALLDKREKLLNSYQTDLKEKYQRAYSQENPQTLNVTIYILISAISTEPYLVHTDAFKSYDLKYDLPETNDIIMKKYIHLSDIIKLENYSLDEEYQQKDIFINSIRSTLGGRFEADVFNKVHDGRKETLMNSNSTSQIDSVNV